MKTPYLPRDAFFKKECLSVGSNTLSFNQREFKNSLNGVSR